MLARLRLGPKLILAPALITLLLLLVAGVSLLGLRRQGEALEALTDVRMRLQALASSANEAASAANAAAYRQFTAINAGFAKDRIDATNVRLLASLNALDKVLRQLGEAPGLAPAERTLVADAAALLPKYRKAVLDTLDMAVSDTAVATNAMTRAEKLFEQLQRPLAELSRTQALAAAASKDTLAQQREQATWLVLWLSAASLLIAVTLTLAVRRSLLAGIEVVTTVAGQLEQGILPAVTTVRGRDEIAVAAGALGATIGKLGGMIGVLQASSDAISATAREISSGNGSLSARTEAFSAAVSATRKSVLQVSEQTQQTSHTAQQAQGEARASSELVAQAHDAALKMADSAQHIVRGSSRISEMVHVVDRIASQTNILALNASVEAARAGDAGRGFAVVAEQVRTLALQARSAAGEIRTLVDGAAVSAQGGQAQAERVAMVTREAQQRVTGMSATFAGIAADLAQHSQRLAALRGEFGRLDDIGSQNAAMVEEAAASARSLEDSAHRLNVSARQFSLADAA